MLKPFYLENIIEAGCDEAGRGCLAGPVVAACVVLPPGFSNPQLNDSKKISESIRYKLREVIENEAISFGVGFVDNNEIDEINILNASILAMHRAIEKLSVIPEHLIIDGNKFKPYKNIKHTCIVKGDSKFASIAAASILAKTYRDDFMQKLHEEYNFYDWNNNKGYPTKKHREGIKLHGATKYHRLSFKLLETQLGINF